MRLLLDTHILLWALANDPKLPRAARDLILNRSNTVCVSSASLWEVSIKHAARLDRMPATGKGIAELCEKAGYEEISIAARHVECLETLRRQAGSPAHNDPFDRIMLAQAKCDGLAFVTHDSLIPDYEEPCVVFL